MHSSFFEEQAARMPQTVAVADGDTSLNYGELNLRASQLASHLRTNGVGPEDLVGLWVERTVEMVVAMLAIVKAGAAYVPLDASMPALRLHEVLEIAKVKLLLTHSRLAGRLETASVRTVLLDKLREDSGKPVFSEEVGPRNLCYVVFTAGSSGPPKGVQIEHRSVVNLA